VLIPDINILVYAYNSDAAVHQAAREWWEKALAQQRPVGMPWVTVLGFIRIMTHRGILDNPMHVNDAVRRAPGHGWIIRAYKCCIQANATLRSYLGCSSNLAPPAT